MTQDKEPSTKVRILDAAERLFSEKGIDATSLRAITQEAGVNLASVNYHFQSKQGLTVAVFSRHIVPINEERRRLLGEFDSPSVEQIVKAFAAPALAARRNPSHGGPQFIRLMGRIYTEPSEDFAQLLAIQFRDTMERFLAALSRALPELPPAELVWRFHFTVGSLIHTIADPAKIEKLSGGLCNSNDDDALLQRIVLFASAGLRAPSPGQGDASDNGESS